MADLKSLFWISLLEKLTSGDDVYEHIPGILRDLCEFFSFGCAFVYEADHTSTLHLREHHCVYKDHSIKDTLNLYDQLGKTLYNELLSRKSVVVKSDAATGEIEQAVADVFSAGALIVLPVKGQADELIALLGIADRRRERHIEAEDLSFTYSVLATVASHIKLQLYQRKVISTDASLKAIMDHMGVDVYVNDFYTHEVLYANQSMAAPYGGVDNLIGKTCWQALYNDKTEPCEYCPQKKIVDGAGNPTKVYSWDYQRPFDGTWFRVLSSAFQWTDGRLAHVVSSFDITENKENENIIRKLAEYDLLTGLPNRYKLQVDCDEYISDQKDKVQSASLLFFDLDGFKKVNDEFGHRAGDDLLRQIGDFLKSNPLTRGRSYRYGGDEFVVLCSDMDQGSLKQIIEALTKRFEEKWMLPDGEVVCRCSIGIANYPADAMDASDIIYKADAAMYHGKRSGTGQAVFYYGGSMLISKDYFAMADAFN